MRSLARTILALSALAVLALAPAPGLAQGCVDYENYIHYLGWGDMEGAVAMDVAVAEYDGGNWGALASGEAWLDFLGLSDSVDFGDDWFVELPGEAMDLFFHERALFVACGSGGLRIVKVINPYQGNPSIAVHGLSLPGVALGVWVDDGVAYVACGFGGVCVVDVDDIAHPVLLDQVNVYGYAEEVCFHDGLVCAAIGMDGLALFAPADPDDVMVIDTPGYAREVHAQGSRAFVADGANGMQIVDLTSLSLANAITLVSDDASDIPVLGLNVRDDRAYLACEEAGLVVVDIATPGGEAISGWIDTPGIAQGVAPWHSYVLVADGSRGIFVADVLNTASVPVTGNVVLPDPGVDVAAADGYVYVVGGFNGLRIFDADDLSPVASAPIPEESGSVLVAGDLALVGGDLMLRLFDVANPTAPQPLDSLALSCRPDGMAVDGGFAYLACDYAGLMVVDISDPENIFLDDSVWPNHFWSNAKDVVVDGGFIYLAQDAGPLMILSASTLNEVGLHWDTAGAVALAKVDDILYLAGTEEGLELVDVSNPVLPEHMWSHGMPGEEVGASAADVAAQASGTTRFAYLAYEWDGYGDLIVMNASEGQWDPLPYGSADAWDTVKAIALYGESVYMVASYNDGAGGLLQRAPAQCMPTAAPETPVPVLRLGGYPNPFNPATTLRFEQPALGRAALRVYDVSGRLVRTLIDGPLGAGGHTVVWDGRDDAGRPLATGVYLARLESAGRVETRKLTLLK
ncbi:MAG: T9SS type A sorting domain-containing protein [Candidatus Krumholzibacteriota bacterium]|nr:T9SS type A sorting domain-containing protein [Candidatus Krumholzibacteriota bacterium]